MCLFPIQLSSSYYVYQVAKQLKGAEELLQAMGFEKIGGSREAQELKYTGDVDSNKIAETAADLVILDGELDRIKSLVVYAQDEHISINLSIILQVRSHPTSIFTDAKFTLNRYHPQGHLPVQRPAAQGQSPPPRAQDSQQQQYATPPPQQLTPLQWQNSGQCSHTDNPLILMLVVALPQILNGIQILISEKKHIRCVLIITRRTYHYLKIKICMLMSR